MKWGAPSRGISSEQKIFYFHQRVRAPYPAVYPCTSKLSPFDGLNHRSSRSGTFMLCESSNKGFQKKELSELLSCSRFYS